VIERKSNHVSKKVGPQDKKAPNIVAAKLKVEKAKLKSLYFPSSAQEMRVLEKKDGIRLRGQNKPLKNQGEKLNPRPSTERANGA